MKTMKLVTAAALTAASLTFAGAALAETVRFTDGFRQDRNLLCQQMQRTRVASIDGKMTIEVRANGADLDIWRAGKKTTARNFCPTTRGVPADTYDGGKVDTRTTAPVAHRVVNNTLTVNARRIVDPDLAVRLPDGCYSMASANGISFQGSMISRWVQCPAHDAHGNAVWKVRGFNQVTGRNEWAILTNTALGGVLTGVVPALITADAIKSGNGDAAGAATAVIASNVAVNVDSAIRQTGGCSGGCKLGGGAVLD